MSPKRKRSLLLGLPLLGFLVVLVVLGSGLGRDPSLLPSVLIDRPLPEFQAQRLDDPEQWLSPADLHGDIALLNIWATWCPTCYQEHTFLNTLRERDIAIYGVNYKDNREAALNWLSQLGDPYRFNIDDPEGQLGIELGVYGAPETFLLDAQGTIRYRHVGALDETVWEREFLPRIRQLEPQS